MVRLTQFTRGARVCASGVGFGETAPPPDWSGGHRDDPDVVEIGVVLGATLSEGGCAAKYFGDASLTIMTGRAPRRSAVRKAVPDQREFQDCGSPVLFAVADDLVRPPGKAVPGRMP